MKTNLLKTVFVFLIAFSGFKASAQDVSPVRHYVGVNYNKLNEDIDALPVKTNFIHTSYIDGTLDWMNNYGISYEYSLKDAASNERNHSFLGRFNFYSVNTSVSSPELATGYNTTTQKTDQISIHSDNYISYSILNVSIAWKKRFFKTPVYFSIGPSATFLPTSKATQEIFISPYDMEQGKQLLPEPGVELFDNNTRAKVSHDKIGDSQWEFGLQAGIFVEFEVPNFLYNLGNNSVNNSIIIAPYGLLTPSFSILKSSFSDAPRPYNERPWRRSPLQAGLDIRMPMPF